MKRSPRDPSQTEFELCAGCHGGTGSVSSNPLAISQLFSPGSRSYHPLQAPARDPSPSVQPQLAQREINCTDCHGNSSSLGMRGPHASAVPSLLVGEYAVVDGTTESESTYALCYSCHDRERVLDSTVFPGHRLHVVDERASCATCHDAHGSLENRALIRFGGQALIPGVLPSGSTGRLEYESRSQGSGSCYLNCHGFDHGPATYGLGEPTPSHDPERQRRSRGLRPRSRSRGTPGTRDQ